MNLESFANRLKGKFIVFDGPDGCGKSTQRELLGRALRDLGLATLHCKDPGGTEIGDRVRHVLLDFDLAKMDVRCETLLFMASRAQLVGELVAPALKKGKVVLCDRFISSTCAYQGAAGYDVEEVLALGRHAVGDTWPDMTFVFDVPVSEGFTRTGRKRQVKREIGQRNMFTDVQTDAMEARSKKFHEKVYRIFLDLPSFYPRPVTVITGMTDPQDVHRKVVEALADAFA
jgi:dTMP kinase